jgi:uncharacterized protein YycO
MSDLRPGDLIFYPDMNDNWKHHIFAVLQEKFKEVGDWKGPILTHAAMISTEPDLIVEMVWPRPRFRFFADDQRPKIIMRPKVDQKAIMRAIYWCYMNINDHYDMVNMLFGYLKVAQAYKVCSGWIDTAFKEAGSPLTDPEKLISPCELASSKFLEVVTP